MTALVPDRALLIIPLTDTHTLISRARFGRPVDVNHPFFLVGLPKVQRSSYFVSDRRVGWGDSSATNPAKRVSFITHHFVTSFMGSRPMALRVVIGNRSRRTYCSWRRAVLIAYHTHPRTRSLFFTPRTSRLRDSTQVFISCAYSMMMSNVPVEF